MTRPLRRAAFLIPFTTALLTACGGGGPLGTSDTIANPAGATGQKLSYAYFQKCVNTVLSKPVTAVVNGVPTTNTCAAGGCHDTTTGTGGALRLVGSAPSVDIALGPAAVRASDMYKNYYSSLGETVVGSSDQSRLLNKPLVRSVLHGGGVVLATPDDAAAKTLKYWINRPMPQGQDEFSSAANTMFNPPDPATGACNIE